jgi:hypothetical protein
MKLGQAFIQLILLGIMVLSVFFFIDGLDTLMSTTSYPIYQDELNVVEIEEESTYQFAFDINYGLSSVMDITYTTTHTRIDFVTMDSISVMVQDINTAELYYIEGDLNTEITINNNTVIGTVELPVGTYRISVIDNKGWLDSGQTFVLLEKGIGYGIVMMIVPPMALIGSLIAFSVIHVKVKRKREREIGFSNDPYTQYDARNTYNEDAVWDIDKDPYEQYDKK